MRLRIRVVDWPRRALAVTDTPRPNCVDCGGTGGTEEPYVDHFGEYVGSDWWPCGCWNHTRRRLLIPLPNRWRRTSSSGYSDQPPF